MLTAEQMLAKGHRTLDWAAELLNGEHGFKGAESLINGHYKAPQAFLAGGRVREARLVAKHLASHFMADGDFHAVKDDPTATGMKNYRNAWITRGLHGLARYDLSRPATDRLAGQMDAGSGGMPAGPARKASADELEWGGTGSTALAMMVVGNWEVAAKNGAFLIRMMEDQPDTKGVLYLRRSLEGELIKLELREGNATTYAIDIGSPGQVYWYLGIAMNTFAHLYLATGEKKWRDAGYMAFEYVKNCHEEIYEIVSNGKIAWGLGAMYFATQDQQFATMAQDVWAWHYRIQEPDGRWLRVGQFGSIDEQPLHVTLDTSLERAFYMFELSRTLDV